MGLLNAEKRAEKHELRTQHQEDTAAESAEKALRNLRQRRAWLTKKMALPSGKIGGQAFNDELDKAAQQLFYVDQAIRSLSN